VFPQWWRHIDIPLLAAAFALVLLGLLSIMSASAGQMAMAPEISRQLMFMAPALLCLVLMAWIDYGLWIRYRNVIYVLNIVMLLAVRLVGKSALGAQRWFQIGPIAFQPSEMAKLALIISLACLLVRDQEGPSATKFFWSLVHVGVPMILILMQPDLGTALVIGAIFLVMSYVAGTNPWFLFGIMAAGAGVAPHVLREYQKQRLLSFINPEADPQGSGWNLIQSMIAIGSGQIWGKGLFAGTQGQLQFVPEHCTDFIFTVVGEEMGLVGAVGIVLLYAILLWRGIIIARTARDACGSLMAVGIVAMLAFHVVVNMGMTMGIMPITGIPLPFLSYGGSSLITNMMAVGLLFSIGIRRM